MPLSPDEHARWKHAHNSHAHSPSGERNSRRVVVLTLLTMAIEIGAGHLFGSMALLADGWHMGTHAAALGITVLAYAYARRHGENPCYSFGTGKVGVLGGYTSAVVLAVVALIMAVESLGRLLRPQSIRFDEAMLVALAGLLVNLLSAWLLQQPRHEDEHEYGPDRPHEHHERHGHHRHDHNLRAAYLHVLADALTSVLAIVALLCGKLLGWAWLDPFMGVVGAVIIARWAYGLLIDTGQILLDHGVPGMRIERIRQALEAEAETRVTDIHLWRSGPGHLSAIVALASAKPQPPDHYKRLLGREGIDHLSVEVNPRQVER